MASTSFDTSTFSIIMIAAIILTEVPGIQSAPDAQEADYQMYSDPMMFYRSAPVPMPMYRDNNNNNNSAKKSRQSRIPTYFATFRSAPPPYYGAPAILPAPLFRSTYDDVGSEFVIPVYPPYPPPSYRMYRPPLYGADYDQIADPLGQPRLALRHSDHSAESESLYNVESPNHFRSSNTNHHEEERSQHRSSDSHDSSRGSSSVEHKSDVADLNMRASSAEEAQAVVHEPVVHADSSGTSLEHRSDPKLAESHVAAVSVESKADVADSSSVSMRAAAAHSAEDASSSVHSVVPSSESSTGVSLEHRSDQKHAAAVADTSDSVAAVDTSTALAYKNAPQPSFETSTILQQNEFRNTDAGHVAPSEELPQSHRSNPEVYQKSESIDVTHDLRNSRASEESSSSHMRHGDQNSAETSFQPDVTFSDLSASLRSSPTNERDALISAFVVSTLRNAIASQPPAEQSRLLESFQSMPAEESSQGTFRSAPRYPVEYTADDYGSEDVASALLNSFRRGLNEENGQAAYRAGADDETSQNYRSDRTMMEDNYDYPEFREMLSSYRSAPMYQEPSEVHLAHRSLRNIPAHDKESSLTPAIMNLFRNGHPDHRSSRQHSYTPGLMNLLRSSIRNTVENRFGSFHPHDYHAPSSFVNMRSGEFPSKTARTGYYRHSHEAPTHRSDTEESPDNKILKIILERFRNGHSSEVAPSYRSDTHPRHHNIAADDLIAARDGLDASSSDKSADCSGSNPAAHCANSNVAFRSAPQSEEESPSDLLIKELVKRFRSSDPIKPKPEAAESTSRSSAQVDAAAVSSTPRTQRTVRSILKKQKNLGQGSGSSLFPGAAAAAAAAASLIPASSLGQGVGSMYGGLLEGLRSSLTSESSPITQFLSSFRTAAVPRSLDDSSTNDNSLQSKSDVSARSGLDSPFASFFSSLRGRRSETDSKESAHSRSSPPQQRAAAEGVTTSLLHYILNSFRSGSGGSINDNLNKNTEQSDLSFDDAMKNFRNDDDYRNYNFQQSDFDGVGNVQAYNMHRSAEPSYNMQYSPYVSAHRSSFSQPTRQYRVYNVLPI